MQEQPLPFVEPKLKMSDSAPHLGAPQALQSALARDGYVYLRNAIPAEAIAWVRGQMIDALVEDGLLDAQALTKHARGEVDTRWTGSRVPGIGIPGRQSQQGFKTRRIWETFVEMPGVRGVFDSVAGGPVTFLPISEFRSSAPLSRTLVHQDGPANSGYGVHTAWFPAMPIDETLGGLAVLPRRDGKPYPPLQETGPSPPELMADPDWVRGDYQPGDMVVFEGSIVHCGLVNRTENRLRLSMEIRFQGPGAPRPVIGRIAQITMDSLTVATDEGEEVTLTINDATRLRGDRSRGSIVIPRSELIGSDLAPGFPVIVGHENGRAISVRGIF